MGEVRRDAESAIAIIELAGARNVFKIGNESAVVSPARTAGSGALF